MLVTVNYNVIANKYERKYYRANTIHYQSIVSSTSILLFHQNQPVMSFLMILENIFYT